MRIYIDVSRYCQCCMFIFYVVFVSEFICVWTNVWVCCVCMSVAIILTFTLCHVVCVSVFLHEGNLTKLIEFSHLKV